MTDWRAWADRVLADVHASLPTDADLVTRRQACLRAKPWEFATTSWGKKVWAKAQRAYLEQHGLPKRNLELPAELPMSPLERAKAATAEREARVAEFERKMSEFDREPRR